MKKTVGLIALITLLVLFKSAYVQAQGLYDWQPALSLSGESKAEGTILWGSFEMRDRVFLGNFFYDKEFDAFIVWNSDNYHINPGLGYRMALGYRIGEVHVHAGAGVATVYNAGEIPGLTNSFLHCTMRAGVDYKRVGFIVDHLSEPFEDDSGITTFGFVVRF